MPPFTALNLLTVAMWATAALWLMAAGLTLWRLHRQRTLNPEARLDGLDLDLPFVSVLVPARNEENRILEDCLQSILAQSYAKFEVVAVNDRSTDETGPIMHALSGLDKRLRVLDGTEPPAGWLGKPHALQQALNAANGQWVLATDADMIFESTALETAVALGLEGSFDAVTFLPRVQCLSFWERVFMPTFGWFMMMGIPLDRVNDPGRPESLGVGGFFLIRREALRRVGEYSAVRADVVEDLRMAEALKRSGARLRIDYAPHLICTRMQSSLQEIWEGFTRNLFAATRFNLLQSVAAAICILLFAVVPPIIAFGCGAVLALGGGGEWLPFLVASVSTWLAQASIFFIINFNWKVPVLYSLTAPLGHALFLAILMNSTWKIASGGGVTWKGRRFYERRGVSPPRTVYSTPNTDAQ